MKRLNSNLFLIGALLLFIFSENLIAQPNVYLRSSGEPWGSSTNIQSLNDAFGEGNWRNLRFETVDVGTLFNGTQYIFLEGSDNHANELEAFLIANLPALQSWVYAGGVLFINAAPNEGDGMSFGFGGVQLDYSHSTNNAKAVDPNHAIFNGPFSPVGTNWSGGSFGHATVTGPGLKPLIVDQEQNHHYVLAEKKWGRGLVLFGGMTMTEFHSPNPEARNLRSNILSLKVRNGYNDAAVASLQSPFDFCAGNHPVEVVIKNEGLNIIQNVTVNWTFDGVAQASVPWNVALDTIDGVGQDEGLVTLGVKNFEPGVSHEIKVWTSFPNGVTDSVTINDTLVAVVKPSLQGTFTIGGTNPDYASFAEAVTDLASNGLCGPVVFVVRGGIYTEQVVIPSLQGSSPVNTVTFRSESGNRNDVVLEFESNNHENYEDNFTLRFDGADYVVFSDMTITGNAEVYSSKVMEFKSGATNNVILNCVVQAPLKNYHDNNALVYSHYGNGPSDNNHHNRLQGCLLTGANYGVYYLGYDSQEGMREEGMRITNNRFEDQYTAGVYLYGQSSVLVTANEIWGSHSSGSEYYGIRSESCHGSLQFMNNKIHLPAGGIGIYQENNYGQPGSEGIIANNFIYAGGDNSSVSGIYVYGVEYQRYYHNSILITNPDFYSFAFNIRYSYNLTIHNNICASNTGSLLMGFSDDPANSGISSDYNNLYTTGDAVIESDYQHFDLAQWRERSSQEEHSMSVNPVFNSAEDLHVRKAMLDGSGTPTQIITDIDDENRSVTNPDIGADEFTASGTDAAVISIDYPKPPFASGNFDIRAVLQNRGAATLTSVDLTIQTDSAVHAPFHWTGSLQKGEIDTVSLGSFPFNSFTSTNLTVWSANPNGTIDLDQSDDTVRVENISAGLPGGTYTIGGTSPDFTSFTAAANAISYGGILGAVTFNVRDGIYQEGITILQVHGASAENKVVFQSESGDSTAVILRNDPDSYITLHLNGADYITFKSITIEIDNDGEAVVLSNQANNNLFSGNVFRGSALPSYQYLVYSYESRDNDNEFRYNLFEGANYAVYYYSDYEPETGTVFRGNIFRNQQNQAIAVYYQESPDISFNIISTESNNTDFYGIRVEYSMMNSRIVNNRIHIPNGGTGIYINDTNGDEGNQGLTANNFVSIGGTSAAYGIQNRYSSYQHIYHNNINIYGESYGAGYYSVNGYYHDVRNNIFSNLNSSSSGVAVNIDGGQAIAALDYNNLYSPGVLGIMSGNTANSLEQWRALTGWEEHSVSVNPLYHSESDLHINKGVLNNAGTPIASVPFDFDGQPRNTTTPDIGADEFEPTGVDVAIKFVDIAETKFGVGVNPVRIVIQNTGANTLTSVEVQWTVNEVSQPNYGWTGSLAPGQEDTLTIGSYDFLFGVAYQISVFLESPNGTSDIDPSDNAFESGDLYAAMGGVYTIGGASPDFPDFASAVQALSFGGVYSATTFNVRPGTYTEQIRFYEIDGASESNRVIFQSENADSSLVVITFAANSASNFTVQLNGADYITFRKLTIRATGGSYARAIDVRSGATYNQFLNNQIVGLSTTSTSTNLAVIYSESQSTNDNHNIFENNAISNGSYGFYYLGYNGGVGYREMGTAIRNNTIANAYYNAIFVQNQDSLAITGNRITTNSGRSNYRGIYLQNCREGFVVSGNYVYCPYGGYGIYVYDSYTSEVRNLIANNIIHIQGTNYEAYGIYGEYIGGVDFYHNTVNITNTVSSSSAFYLYGSSSGNVNILNNIFANTGGGYGLSIYNSSTVETLDYNNYFVTGPVFGYWESLVTDFSAWKNRHGFDVNSRTADPRFVSSTDLHTREIALNGTATPLDIITHDFDGDPRDPSSPDIGADEFTPPSTDAGILALSSPAVPFNIGDNPVTVQLRNSGVDQLTSVLIHWEFNGIRQDSVQWTGSLQTADSTDVVVGTKTFDPGVAYSIKVWTSNPNGTFDGDLTNDTIHVENLYTALTGVYTVGGSSPDFPTFNAAVTALSRGGVVDSVIFNVRAGTYNEQISITDIKGSAAPNTIVFQSESGDSTAVVLTFSANSSNNYTVELAGADGVTFRRMTLTTVNNSYGRVVSIRNKSHNNRFENNILQGRNIASSSINMAVIYSNSDQDNNNLFVGNRILFGSYGMYYYGDYEARDEGLIVRNNVFDNQYYYGAYLYYQSNPQVIGNIIRTNSAYTNYTGLYIYSVRDGAVVRANDISITNGGSGIYYRDGYLDEGQSALIANNFVNIKGANYYSYGLNIGDASYVNIYHNTSNIAGSSSDTYSFYLQYTSEADIRNNIFTNMGNGLAIYALNSSFSSDYNNLYTGNQNIASYNGIPTGFSAWKNATGGDQHSVSIDPRYVSMADLHTREIVLNDAGQALALVADDIDGEPRNAVSPDIGADEFTPGVADAGVDILVSPRVPFNQGIQPMTVALKNHGLDTLSSVSIHWTVNDSAQSVLEWTGALPSADTTWVVIGNISFEPAKAYVIKAWSADPNNAIDADHSNDTISVNNLYAALTGTYTIGGASPDFSSFSEAIVALDNGGIVGDVIFNVRAGSYNEQISIPAIAGTSAARRITFQTESGNNDVVVNFTANSAQNYIVRLDGASYITLRNFTFTASSSSYGVVVRMQNGAHHNTFENNIFNGINVSSSGEQYAVVYNASDLNEEYNTFTGNRFVRGSYGYYGFGREWNDTESGIVLENNRFENQYYTGIYGYYLDALQIKHNLITTNSSYTSYFGIRLYSCSTGVEVSRNDIQIRNGGYGIYLESNQASSANRSIVANNFISVGGTTTSHGIYSYYNSYQNIYHNNVNITSTLISTNSTAAYFTGGSSLDIKNNIFVHSRGGYALYFSSTSSYTSDYNNLYTTGSNLAYWSGNRATLEAWKSYSGQDMNSISVDPFFHSDTDLHVYNVQLNAAAVKLNVVTNDFDGNPRTATPDIGADEFIPPTEDASIQEIIAPVNPVIAGPNDIVVQLLNNATANLNNVTINWTVNGNPQPAFEWTGSLAPSASDSVTIGSFLFDAGTPYDILVWSSNPNGLEDPITSNDSVSLAGIYVGMSGIYTIGGPSADFPNFTQAVQALHTRSVAAPVTFRVANGIYSERITINEILGASQDRPVVFESASGDSTKVTLTSATNSSENYTLRFSGADHVTFRKMTISSTGSTYGRVIDINGIASHNRIENCVLQGVILNSTSVPDRRAIIYSSGSRDEFNVFRNNIFRDGSYGIYYYGTGTSAENQERGTIIENNLFEDQYYAGIWIYYQSAPKVRNNTVLTFSTYTSFYSIYGTYIYDSLQINNNVISSNSGGTGIGLVNSQGSSGIRGHIYNNFIHLGGTSNAYGLYTNSSNYQDISFNSVNIRSTNTGTSAAAMYNASGSNIRVRNNILVNGGGGYAYYTNNTSSIAESDHNDLYTTGTNLAFWQSNYTSLQALQTASGKDANSVSVDPSFAGTSDLHVSQPNLDGAGTPIAGIDTDIDGQLRHDATPDIGADEFGAGLTTNDIGVVALVAPANGCSLGNEESIVIRIQNFGIDTISNFSVTYLLNDTLTVTENISDAQIPGGKSLEYAFETRADFSAAGFYNFTFFTILPGDSNVNNDTLYTAARHYPAVNGQVSPNDTICQGSYVTLSASGGNSYSWRTLGSTYVFRTGSYITVNPGADITYVVETGNTFGCTDFDTVSVKVLPAPERPSIEIVGSTSVCTRDTVRLISSVKDNIFWNTGASTSEIQVFDPGTYTVTHRDTLTGCTSSRSVTLSYTPPPYIYAARSSICEGQSITLSVVYGAQYLWSTGHTSSSITVSPHADSTFVVDVINADGCEYLGLSITIRVNPTRPAPTITYISPDTQICPGMPATLVVQGNAQTYQWSNGYTGSAITVSPTTDTQYTVTATNGDCSEGSAQASVFVDVLPAPPAPIIVATGSSTLSFCDADSIMLTSSDVADSLLWSTGATTQSIIVEDPGVYTVSVYNQYNCSNSASVTITDPPVPYIAGKNTVCEGESTALSVNNGAFYNWSTGATTRSITVMPDTTTMYYVDIKNEEGCEYRDSIRVTILPKPVITGISADTTVCSGADVTLTVSGTADSFIWSQGGSGTSIKVNPTQTTQYVVTATNGCTDQNFNDFGRVTVSILPLPEKPVITASGSTTICEDDDIQLTSSISGTIVWSTGDTTQSISVSNPGIYRVTNTNQFGCIQAQSIEVFNPAKPQIVANGFTTICRGDEVQLTYTNATTFSWSTGQTTPTIQVSPADTTMYYVQASNALGCIYADSIRINVIAPVPPDSASNMLPANDLSGLSLPLALSWTPSFNASSYDIYIWLDSLARPATPFVANVDQISYLVKAGLSYGAVYNWQVVSKNSCHQTPGPVQQFSLRELPDLVVDKVETPKTAFSGQMIDIAWEVSNQGFGDTDLKKTWVDAAYLSADETLDPGLDTYLGGVVNLTALNAGEGYRNTASFRLPKGIAGERYVIIVADYYNAIAETNNNNNSHRNLTSMLVNLTPPPDLQVVNVQVPENVFSGQTIDVTWTVSNRGTGSTDVSSWRDRLFISQDSVLRTSVRLGEVTHSGHLDPNDAYTRTLSVQVPEGIFGPYFVYVVTDVNNNLFEHAFESNNTGRSNGMQVILTPPPDLVVTGITIPDSASNNETITVSWEVQNQGGSPVTGKSWNDRVYISNLPVFDASKATSLGDKAVSPELNLGDSYISSRSVKIPDKINGPYYIYVATDFNGRVFEYDNEDNNITRSDTIDILSPDLVVEEIILPDTAWSGKSTDVVWTVRNNGPGTLVSSKWEDEITVDNSAIYHADSVAKAGTVSYTSALAPGDTIRQQKTITIPDGVEGTYFVHIQTDRKTQVYEADKETNNFSYASLYVKLSPWADLVPQIVTFNRDTATAGDAIPVTYRVTNSGEVDARAPWVDRIYISSFPAFNADRDTVVVGEVRRSNAVAVDSSYSASTTFTPNPWVTEGAYYFYLVADAGDVVYEHTDEANNVIQLGPVYIREYPLTNFAVTAITAPDSSFTGTNISMQWEVKNIGEAKSLSGFWFDAVLLSDDSLFDQTGDLLLKSWQRNGPLNPGASYSVNQTLKLPDGIYGNKYLLVVNDYGKDEKERSLLREADRSNNFRAIPIQIKLTPPADLTVTQFTAPTEGISGQPVSISWTVKNAGAGPTTATSWIDRLYLSTDFKIDKNEVVLHSYTRNSGLNAGDSYTYTADVFLPINAEGNYILILKTDNNDVQYEHGGEHNNTITGVMAVTKPLPSDLSVVNVMAPDTVTAGETITVEWTVRNMGTNPASGVMSDIVYYSLDEMWDINDVVLGEYTSNINLPPLSEQQRSLTASVSGVSLADYHIIVRTDVRNNIYESNDDNNTTSSEDRITISVPELMLDQVRAATLANDATLYYRIEVPPSLTGESLLVTLEGDSLNGSNELYIKYGQVPTRVEYDLSHEFPYVGDQEIVIPDVVPGTYYVMVHGSTREGDSQSIELLAKVLHFEIRSVNARSGGNTGEVTVQINGSKFVEDMQLMLRYNNVIIEASEVQFINSTRVFATFDLNGVESGIYDLVGINQDLDTAALNGGFSVEEGEAPLLLTNVVAPSSTRPGSIVAINIEFANGGNVNIKDPVVRLISAGSAPVSFTVDGLDEGQTELQVPLTEPGGPEGVLRPGVLGTVVIYGKATSNLSFILVMPQANKVQ